jgi:hypothetical protein
MESRMGHPGIVLLDVELHEGAEPLDRVQRVEVQPLMLERAPERFDHRIREGNVNLRKDAVQACTEQRGVHRVVDVLDAGVGVQ